MSTECGSFFGQSELGSIKNETVDNRHNPYAAIHMYLKPFHFNKINKISLRISSNITQNAQKEDHFNIKFAQIAFE